MSDSSNSQVEEVLKAVEAQDSAKLSIDQLTHDILIGRLASIHEQSAKEIKELNQRQKEVNALHDLIAKINKLTDNKGKVKVDDDLLEMLNKAITSENNSEAVNELKIGKDNMLIKEKGKDYSTEERQRLIENIRMHIDDLNTKNDMQLQTVTKLTNERYETYQMVRAIEKPHDEDKKQKARAIAGR